MKFWHAMIVFTQPINRMRMFQFISHSTQQVRHAKGFWKGKGCVP